MRSRSALHNYQNKAVDHIKGNPRAMLWMDLGLGKASGDNEPVATPTGWVPMGELSTGDLVIGSDGKPTRILGTFPQGEVELVKVTMSDGSWTRVTWDHLWYVETNNHRKRGQVGHVMTTRQLVDSGLYATANQFSEVPKWYVPMVQPVEYHPVTLEMDPYFLGVILGDGSIKKCGSVEISTDPEILNNYEGVYRSCKSDKIESKYFSWVKDTIKGFGLEGHKSWEKFTPKQFLLGSPDQRLALLQGLLDTDGYPIDKGGVEFSSTSEQLTDDVVELAQSLGGIAKKRGPRTTFHQGGEGCPSWRVNVKLPGHLTPFRLKRKLDKWVRPTKYQPIRKIVSVVPDGVESATCIKVEAADSLYVTRGFIVTHNTISTLTSITDLMNSMQVYGVLVLGPLRVCQTVWAKEARQWHHTSHLKFSLIHGKERHRKWALAKHANVYLLNYEGVPWAVDAFINQYLARGIPLPFNMIVFDEVTKLKSTRTKEGGAWGRSLQKILPYVPWRVGLTATPAPNGLQDLFGQYLVIDDGQRLGTSYNNFESAYFVQADRAGYKYKITDQGEEFIQARVSDITLQMEADDYLELPPSMDNVIEVVLPDKLQAQYDKLEKEMFLELDSGAKLDVENAAILSGKCRQFANGAIYTDPEDRTHWDNVHSQKLDALVEVIEELRGDPLLLGYQFKHDAARIKQRLDKEKIKYVHFDSKIRGAEAQELEAAWNKGEYPVMLGHGQSIGHGLNLQYGCANIGWFGLPWSSEIYRQFNGRVKKRQGQKRPTTVHKFITANTVDVLVDSALEYKTQSEEAIRAAVDNYRTNKLGV